MAYTKNKNIVEYKGKKYFIRYDFATKTLECNHPNPYDYIYHLTDHHYGKLFFILMSEINRHSFLETILTNEEVGVGLMIELYKSVYFKGQEVYSVIQFLKESWKKVLKHSELINHARSLKDIISIIKMSDMTPLEQKYFKKGIKNRAFLSKYAGQLEKYDNILDFYSISQLVNRYEFKERKFTKSSVIETLLELNLLTKSRTLEERLETLTNTYRHLDGKNEDGWKFEVLKTIEDFKQEAEVMHNCLYWNRWFEKVVENGFLVLRAKNEEGISIDFAVDLEKMALIQAFYDYDKPLHEKDRIYLNNWIAKNLRGAN